jgi:5-formyltetrahydrofolate cyclo-ligase
LKLDRRRVLGAHLDEVAAGRKPNTGLKLLRRSVALAPSGARVGKGEGYSDLEFAILSDLGLVDEETVVATTVHEPQVVGDDEVTPDAHDVPMDLVVTPERVIRPDGEYDRPVGVDWDGLGEERVEEMPVLARLRADL